MPLRKIIRLQ
ncbi:uncharacterized protein FFFS_15989 [Fusarium fujikuroi]|nr:uncharacterized protein FFFS_15989 [Fusarium fujikuroi]